MEAIEDISCSATLGMCKGSMELLESTIFNNIGLLRHPQKASRLHGASAINSHLKFIRDSKLLSIIRTALSEQLSKEDDTLLVEDMIKVLTFVALRDFENNMHNNPYGATLSVVATLETCFLEKVNGDDAVKIELIRSLYILNQHFPIDISRIRIVLLEVLKDNHPKCREWALKLLVSTFKEGMKSPLEQKNTCNEISWKADALLRLLESFFLDIHSSVREAAVRCTIYLYTEGFCLSSLSYRPAIDLLLDFSESVRIATIELISICLEKTQQLEHGCGSVKDLDDVFIQVCTMLSDMSMKIRQKACQVLGFMTHVSEDVMLQTIKKKSQIVPDAHPVVKRAPIIGINGSSHYMTNDKRELLLKSIAGAFVHALEDEFYEVRLEVIKTLSKLSKHSEKMAFASFDLILDMLIDDVSIVRREAVEALFVLASEGYAAIEEKHLQSVFGILEDAADLRDGGYKLLAAVTFPSAASFCSTIQFLLRNADRHPEDKEKAFRSLHKLATSHASYAEFILDDLLQEMRLVINGENGLGDPKIEGLLVFFMTCANENPTIISLLPSDVFINARVIRHKLPPDVPILETSFINGMATTYRRSKGCTLQFETSSVDSDFASSIDQNIMMQIDEKAKVESQHFSSDVLSDLNSQIRATAHNAKIFLEAGATCEALKLLSLCRKNIKFSRSTETGYVAALSWNLLYLQSLSLIVKFRDCIMATRDQMKTLASGSCHYLLYKLGELSLRMHYCFHDLHSDQKDCQYELLAYSLICRMISTEKQTATAQSVQLCDIIRDALHIHISEDLGLPSPLQAARKYIIHKREELSNDVVDIAMSFWPGVPSVSYGIRETQAALSVPRSSFEHPIRFTCGLPLGIMIHLIPHNIQWPQQLWLRMCIDGSKPTYHFLDYKEIRGMRNEYKEVVQLHNLPSVATCMLKLTVMLQCSTNELTKSERRPGGYVLPISGEKYLHLAQMDEKGLRGP